MRKDVKFLVEWVRNGKNACAEEQATLCYLKILVDGENACAFYDVSEEQHFEYLYIPAVHLAEGIAIGWWDIFGGRDRNFSISPYRNGFALPDLKLCFDGCRFEVFGSQYSSENPKIKFWRTESDTERKVAESALSKFVDQVVERLSSEGVKKSGVESRWSQISYSRENPEEQVFCEAAGAIGADPYAISESDASFIELAASRFSGEILIEFLAGLRESSSRCSSDTHATGTKELDWLSRAESRRSYQFRLGKLDELANDLRDHSQRITGERAWGQGYRMARVFRKTLELKATENIGPVNSLSKILGNRNFRRASGETAIRAAVSRTDGGKTGIHLRKHGRKKWEYLSGEFAFARAVGDAVCFPDDEISVVNNLKSAERQAVGRAFAAELLAPIDRILDMRDSGKDVGEIAESLDVSPITVERQIENKDRIKLACAVN